MDVNDVNIQIILLSNDEVLITQIEEIVADLGEPNCRLISPYKIVCSPSDRSYDTVSTFDADKLVPWLSNFTDDSEILISSDKILTIVEPHKHIIDLYLKLATT